MLIATLLGLADRLEREAPGRTVWRAAKPDGAYCIEFGPPEYWRDAEEECRRWIRDHADICERRGYTLQEAHVHTQPELAMREVAAQLRAIAGPKPDEEEQFGLELIDRMATLLGGVVNALKGEPPPRTLWSWHDVPALAAAARDGLQELVGAIDPEGEGMYHLPISQDDLERFQRLAKGKPDRWINVKHQHEYDRVGTAIAQCAAPITDNAELTLYRAMDGQLYVRPPAEFNDGRFTRPPTEETP